MMQLHYYRCIDCLSVATADEYKPRPICSHCAGLLEYMGRVQAGRLVEDREVCKCDGRCIFAAGPNCDCHCHGDNHGSGWLGGGFEIIQTDRGPVPRLRMPDNAKAATIAAEFRWAFDALKSATELARGDWSRHYQLQGAASKARTSRNHKNRMRIIGDALPSYKPMAPPVLQAALF